MSGHNLDPSNLKYQVEKTMRDLGIDGVAKTFDTVHNVPDSDIAFGEWYSLNMERPAIVTINFVVASDGNNMGLVGFEVQDGEGNTVTPQTTAGNAPPQIASETYQFYENLSLGIPPEGRFRMVNNLDPSGNNNIQYITWVEM